MTHDSRTPDRGPEQPRVEPEIIPPDRDGRGRSGPEGVFFRFDERDGVRRVFVARPGWPTILLGLLATGVIAALVLLLLAGLVLIWVPLLVIGVVLALVSGAFRRRLASLRAWWASR